MNTKNFLCVILFIFFVSLCFAQEPYWWGNPHRDDDFFMYERGFATSTESDLDAIQAAIVKAKDIIVERIGIVPALQASGFATSGEFALLNCTTSDSSTQKKGRTWSAWVMLKYPQAEKKKLLARWETSLESIQSLQKVEAQIPEEFTLKLDTLEGRNYYRDGENVVFTVRSSKDAYLIVLDHQSDGSTVMLFPNKFNPDGKIRKNTTVYIPSPASSYAITVVPPYGDDRIEAIACTDESSFYQTYKNLLDDVSDEQGFAVATRGLFLSSIDRETFGTRTKTKTQWSKATITLSTFE